jgi:hypothetical protein
MHIYIHTYIQTCIHTCMHTLILQQVRDRHPAITKYMHTYKYIQTDIHACMHTLILEQVRDRHPAITKSASLSKCIGADKCGAFEHEFLPAPPSPSERDIPHSPSVEALLKEPHARDSHARDSHEITQEASQETRASGALPDTDAEEAAQSSCPNTHPAPEAPPQGIAPPPFLVL